MQTDVARVNFRFEAMHSAHNTFVAQIQEDMATLRTQDALDCFLEAHPRNVTINVNQLESLARNLYADVTTMWAVEHERWQQIVALPRSKITVALDPLLALPISFALPLLHLF